MSKTEYEYMEDIDDIMDDALNDLSPEDFSTLLDHISIMLADYEN